MSTPATPQFIVYGGKELPMPEGMSLAEAKVMMARHFPELADPKVETKTVNGRTLHTFTKQAGRKGAGTAIARALAGLAKVVALKTGEGAIDFYAARAQVEASQALVERLREVPPKLDDAEVTLL